MFDQIQIKHIRRSQSTIFNRKIENEKQTKANIESSQTIKRNTDRHKRESTEYEYLYATTSPSRKKDKMIEARILRTFDNGSLKHRHKISTDCLYKKLYQSTDNLTNRVSDYVNREKVISKEIKKDSQEFKHKISKSIHELKESQDMVMSRHEQEYLVKRYQNFKPAMYTISKSGSSYRLGVLKKNFSLKNKLRFYL